jgi:2-keto-4-pentenoate hydratase/2-oxohepta-3-ene-1,7-dioic acid hydratase in catechol pathway
LNLARFTHAGATRLGVVIGNEVADVGGALPQLPADVGVLLEDGGDLEAVASHVKRASRLPLVEVRLEAPIVRPPEFLAIALNYRSHVAESRMKESGVPVVFNKQVSCVSGPFDPITIPEAAPDQVDYEGELGVVIGRRCHAVPVEAAPQVVAGYLVVNDVSVRDWQWPSPTMTMGKSWDSHGPIGPWLVTADAVPDPHDLTIRTWVSGELRQDSSTAHMIHNCWQLIAHLSTALTLLPGTIISTGTPEGVGFAMDPPGFLHPGDTVRVEVSGLGAIENPVVAGS